MGARKRWGWEAMKTNAQLAAELLQQGASYMRTVGKHNPSVKDDLDEKAGNVEEMARRIDEDPKKAAEFMRESAKFFRFVGEQNPPLAEQMQSNATTFEYIADRVESDPGGEAPPPVKK